MTGTNALANALVWGPNPTLNFGGTANLQLSALVNISSGTYNLNDPNTHGTLSGVISGPGALNITGNPTLANTNTYTGGTTFNRATAATITNNQGFGPGPLTFNNGGFQSTVALTGSNAIANPWTITAGSAAYLAGGNAIQLTASTSLAAGNNYIHLTNAGLTVTLSGLIGGAGALVRATDGANQSNGTLILNNPGNTFSGGFTLQSLGGNVDVQGASTVLSGTNIVSGPLGTGTVTIGGANNGWLGMLNSSAVPVTLANPMSIYDGANYTSVAGLTFSGPVTLTGPGNNGSIDFWLGTNNNIAITGAIGGAGKGVNVRSGLGTGGLTLGGSNTYTGATSITYGTLIAGSNVLSGSAGAFGNATSAITLGDANSGGNPAALVTNGPYTIARPITVNATAGPATLGTIGSGVSTFSGAIALNRSGTLSAAAGGSVLFTGSISGTGGITAGYPGSSNVSFATTNSYSGGTTVGGGQLTLDYSGLTPSAGSVGGVISNASPLASAPAP